MPIKDTGRMFTLKKIRVALIGYGRSGRNIHRKLLLQLPDKYEFVAFVEQDKERREMFPMRRANSSPPKTACRR